MNRSILSTAPANLRIGFAPQQSRPRGLTSAVLMALTLMALAAATLAAAARPVCAQSLPAAWVADERTAEHRGGQTFAERTPADDRPASVAAQPDGRNNAAYAPPPASPGMRPQRIESLGNPGRLNAPNNDVVPIAHAADAPALAPVPTSATPEPTSPARRPEPAPQPMPSGSATPLSPPRPGAHLESPPLDSAPPQRLPEAGIALDSSGAIAPASSRPPTLLPAPAAKTPSNPVSLTPHRQGDSESRGSSVRALGTIAGSLAIVLTLLFVALWLLRRTVPAAAQPLPLEVVEVLGRAPLSGRQQMHLLRCGRKLLLVSVTPECAKTLTEITDPLEVDRLSGLCQQNRPNSATAAFRRVFEQFASGQSEK